MRVSAASHVLNMSKVVVTGRVELMAARRWRQNQWQEGHGGTVEEVSGGCAMLRYVCMAHAYLS